MGVSRDSHRLGAFARFSGLEFRGHVRFELANAHAENELYEITALSERGGRYPAPWECPSRGRIFADSCFDTLLVIGVLEVQPATRGMIDLLRRSLSTSRRIGSICTGAFFVAESGVLDGKRATTHWQFARDSEIVFRKITRLGPSQFSRAFRTETGSRRQKPSNDFVLEPRAR